MTTIPASHRDLLTGEVVLATIGPNGDPQLTAMVTRLTDDDVIELSVNTARQKVTNLRLDPRATVFRADPTTPTRTIEVRVAAEIVDDPDSTWSRDFLQQLGHDIDTIDPTRRAASQSTATPLEGQHRQPAPPSSHLSPSSATVDLPVHTRSRRLQPFHGSWGDCQIRGVTGLA